MRSSFEVYLPLCDLAFSLVSKICLVSHYLLYYVSQLYAVQVILLPVSRLIVQIREASLTRTLQEHYKFGQP